MNISPSAKNWTRHAWRIIAAIFLLGGSSQAQTPLLPDDPYSLFVSSMGGGKSVLAPVEGRAFGKALRITVADKPANHWDVQFVVKNTAPAAAGATIAFWFSCRSMGGEGHMLATLKDKAGKTVFRKEYKPGAAWSDQLISGTLEPASESGHLMLILTFGWKAQQIEIGGLALLALEPGAKPENLPPPPQTRVTASGAVSAAPAAMTPANASAPEAEEELPPLPEGVRRFAIFKWDDLVTRGEDVPAQIQRATDYVLSNRMHASWGIICNSFEKNNAAYHEWIKKRAVENGGPIEFWLHGWDHFMGNSNGKSFTEFNGPEYDRQKSHFEKSMAAMKERTGLTFRTFGSAGNQYDASAYKVLEEFPEVKVWLYGDPRAGSSKFLIPRLVEGERAPGRPDYAAFMKSYKPKRTSEALLLQGHPGQWNDAGFDEFVKIHARLVKDKWEFVTPYEYYRYKNP